VQGLRRRSRRSDGATAKPVRTRKPPTQLLVSVQSEAALKARLDSEEGQRCLDEFVTLIGIGLLSLLGIANPSFAGMVWSARAIDPALIRALKNDSKLLDQTLFGDQSFH
jgi:hypothetical protein